MKKGILIGIVLVVIFLIMGLCFGTTTPVSKYWQDVIRKPNQAWITAYGYNNESVLAFNVRSILEAQDAMARKIVAVEKEHDNLKAIVGNITYGGTSLLEITPASDVNQPSDPNE